MDGNPETAGNEPDDLIAWQGVAAAGKFDQAALQPLHNDAVGGFLRYLFGRYKRLSARSAVQPDKVVFYPRYDFFQRYAAVADRSVEVINCVVLLPCGDIRNKFFPFLGRRRDQVAAHFLFQRQLALRDIFLPLFLFEPGTDLIAGLAGFNDLQPVSAGAVALGG